VILPNPTRQTEWNKIAEGLIAWEFAQHWGGRQLKIGRDISDKEKPHIDRALWIGDEIVAMFECRECNYRFGVFKDGWWVKLQKVLDCRTASRLHCVPVFLVVRFNDALAWVDSAEPYRELEKIGPTVPRDEFEGPGALFRFDQFQVSRRHETLARLKDRHALPLAG